MKESAQAAFSYIRSHAAQFGIKPDFQDNFDIHIHIPEGATPKDGPSAGVALAVALISAMSKRPVKASLAMTGEITLRGNVLVIGGLKEKVLAALRAGIKTVLYPRANEKELTRNSRLCPQTPRNDPRGSFRRSPKNSLQRQNQSHSYHPSHHSQCRAPG